VGKAGCPPPPPPHGTTSNGLRKPVGGRGRAGTRSAVRACELTARPPHTSADWKNDVRIRASVTASELRQTLGLGVNARIRVSVTTFELRGTLELGVRVRIRVSVTTLEFDERWNLESAFELREVVATFELVLRAEVEIDAGTGDASRRLRSVEVGLGLLSLAVFFLCGLLAVTVENRRVVKEG